ncbi:helix-turn-helix domain-containing protein [Nonomuraea sp. NPDC001699]
MNTAAAAAPAVSLTPSGCLAGVSALAATAPAYASGLAAACGITLADSTATAPSRIEMNSHRRSQNRQREVKHLNAYKVEEVAELLGVGRDKIYQLIRTRQLHSIKIGRARRITDQHLADFITSLEQIDQD